MHGVQCQCRKLATMGITLAPSTDWAILKRHHIDLAPIERTCRNRAGWQPGLVLDPFFGAGTVGLVPVNTGGTGWA